MLGAASNDPVTFRERWLDHSSRGGAFKLGRAPLRVALAILTPNGVAQGRFVEIGGIEQWIQIRGDDADNPLLVLAGGPGNSLVPLVPVFRSWERQFTVVQSDQRGAGKTFGRNGENEAPMTIDRMVRDGVEVTQYLLAHLHKRKLLLVGHPWGTMLGVLMAKARPDLYCAYVGTGHASISIRSKRPGRSSWY